MSTTTTPKPETKPRIESKQVRHDYTERELAEMGGELSRAVATSRGLEAEFDQVKQSYKAKLTEAATRIDSISTALMNRWEFRMEKCRVVLRPKDRKKDFFLADAPADAAPIATEDMTNADFELDLIAAEARFDLREEITLFPPAGASHGILVVGRFKGLWYTALRINIDNKHKVEERLDSEQKSVKTRWDAIKLAAGRAQQWFADTLGEENAAGFKDPIAKAIEAHKEREE